MPACQVQWDEEKSSRLWAILSDPESQGNIDCTFQPPKLSGMID